MKPSESPSNTLENGSLLRRLAAIFYDLLLLLGVLFALSAVAVWINRGIAVEHPVYYLALLVAVFFFYGWFWTHGGQTLGLRTWRLQVVVHDRLSKTRVIKLSKAQQRAR